jgi:general secretion pathway protein I
MSDRCLPLRPSGRSRMRGFTLLEVVIAFAILGLSLAVLFGAFQTALSRSRRDAQLSEATLLAQSLLARAGTELTIEQPGQDGEWSGYRYVLTQEAVAAPSLQRAVTIPTQRVTVRVSWVSGSGTHEIEISTLKLARKVSR